MKRIVWWRDYWYILSNCFKGLAGFQKITLMPGGELGAILATK